MNEVNIIETNSNKKYKKKKKNAARSYRHNKVILVDRNIYHKPCLHIHQHFRSISSSTINFQLTQINFHNYNNITSLVFTYTNTSDLYHNPQSIFNDPTQFTHQHFKSISSSTINLQILTKKKHIRGNKVPNDGDGDGDEAQSELRRG